MLSHKNLFARHSNDGVKAIYSCSLAGCFPFLEPGIRLVWVRVGIRSMIMLGERVFIFGLPRKRFLIMLIYVANNSFFHLSVLYQ